MQQSFPSLFVALLLVPPVLRTSASAGICLAPASTQMVTNNNADAVVAVKETFSSFLTGPTLKVRSLSARLTTQAREEAKQTGCDYVLFATLKHERKSSGGGLLGSIARSAAHQGAVSIAGSAGSAVRGTAASVVNAAVAAASANVASTVKVRDELELGYRLESVNGRVMLEKKGKRKARADGEDILTPLVEQASEQIAAAVSR